MIERLILTGLITSTEYCQQIRNIWNVQFMEADSAKRLAPWVWEYFEQWGKAPGTEDIYPIFFTHVKHLPEREAKDVEGMLNDLMDDYNKDNPTNLQYLLDETQKYFKARRLTILSDTITSLVTRGQIDEAEKQACDYKPAIDVSETDIDFSHPSLLEHIEHAFDTTSQSLYEYPGQYGEFINSQIVQGGFIAFLAPEKRGKTYKLLDMALRGCKQGIPTAFISAGDMNKEDLIMRVCVYQARKSNEIEYCGQTWEPVKDCVLNQLNECRLDERESDFGIFADKNKEYLHKEVTQADLIEAFKENPDYRPCYNCHAYKNSYLGAVWIKQVDAVEPLSVKEAQKIAEDFFIKHKHQFILSCHPNDTLTINQIKARKAAWQKESGFIPRQIVIDYADIMTTEENLEERPRQNKIWKGLRRLSQEDGNPLIITATQSDADSYTRSKLRMTNFSEDKRKYGHATCFLSMNQDPEGREKEIGIMRIGKLAQRKGKYNIKDEVTILQNLSKGRPFLTSYK